MKSNYLTDLIVVILVYSILWRMADYAMCPDIRPALEGKPRFDGLVDGLLPKTVHEQTGGTPTVPPSDPFRQNEPVLNVDGKPHRPVEQVWAEKRHREEHQKWLEEFHKQPGGGP